MTKNKYALDFLVCYCKSHMTQSCIEHNVIPHDYETGHLRDIIVPKAALPASSLYVNEACL